jgi:MoaA/NifB/PqqE/SkfB family radical SAM enzyme
MIELHNLDTIPDMTCNAPKGSVSIVHPDGFVKPCCYFNYQDDKWLLSSNIAYIDSLDDVINSEEWKNYNPDPHCESCIREEIDDVPSLRKYWNSTIPSTANSLEHLELALDFTCNMMCRMCGPRQSSQWNGSAVLDDMKITEHNHPNSDYYVKTKGSRKYTENLKWILSNTDLSNLKAVTLVGGEPLYSKNLKWFISLLKENSNYKNVSITIITNGSVKPPLNLLKGFRKVNITVSIDAIGSLATSIRMGIDWNIIDTNVRYMVKHYNVKVHSTVSILNINKMQEVIDYCKELNISSNYAMLHGPKHLLLDLIPIIHRSKWKTTDYKINKMLDMNHYANPRETFNFIKAVEILDSVSDISFIDANPEVYDIAQGLVEQYKEEWKLPEDPEQYIKDPVKYMEEHKLKYGKS